MGPQNSGSLAHWSIPLRLPYRGPQYCSASPLLLDPDPSWQSPRSVSLSFPTPGIHIGCVPMFPFLYRISCMRESLLSTSCAEYNADWYAQLGALPTYVHISCPVYLKCVHTDSNLVIRLCTTRLCDIKRVVVMQKVVVRLTSTHPQFFFINLVRLQCKKWQKYVQITVDSTRHLCETIMSH